MMIVLPYSSLQRLEQVQDLVARLAIEVAGRLVAQQQRRIGDDRARDADTLFLATGQFARPVPGAIRETDELAAPPRRASCAARDSGS